MNSTPLWILLGIVAFIANAQANLQSILAIYQQSSPALQAEAFAVQASKEEAERANGFPAPELGLEWGSRAVSPGMSNETMYYGGVLLSQEFMFPGKRNAMQQEGKSKTSMAQYNQQSMERAGAFRIASLYLEIAMEQGKGEILDSTLKIVTEMLVASESQISSGMGGMENHFRLQAELAKLRMDSVTLVGNIQTMRAMLSAEVGMDTLLNLPQKIQFHAIPIPLPPFDTLLSLQSRRPELLGMNAEIQMASSDKRSQDLARFPDLMVQGRYMGMMGPDEWSLMLGVKIPVAPWAYQEISSKASAAKSRIHATEARKKNMENMFRQQMRSAWIQMQTTLAKIEFLRNTELVAVNNAVQAAQNAWLSSKNELQMVLDAVRMKTMTKERLWMTEWEYYQAVLSLERNAGETPTTWLGETP